jgi:3-oxoadipate enol-lactonase
LGRRRAWKAGALAALVLGVGGFRALMRHRRPPPAPGAPPVRRVSWLGRTLDPYRNLPDRGFVLPRLPPAEVVTVPGRGEMFLRRGGRTDGTPVLLLHGWMATADLNWFLLFEALGARHPIIALDLRGHGRAPRSAGAFTLEECADDAAAVLRQLGIARAILVGYSMGGPVATLVWHRHRDLVAGLVLEATAMEFGPTWVERLLWRSMGIVAVLLRWPTGRIVLLRSFGQVDELPRELLVYRAWAEGEFRRNDPTEMAEAGRALAAFDARSFASDVDVPTAVVVTTRDRLVPPNRQRELARAIGATVFEIEEDHSAVATRPDDVAAVTLRAIAAVDAGLAAERWRD